MSNKDDHSPAVVYAESAEARAAAECRARAAADMVIEHQRAEVARLTAALAAAQAETRRAYRWAAEQVRVEVGGWDQQHIGTVEMYAVADRIEAGAPSAPGGKGE